VELLARRVNGRVTVRVVDHGPGISEADREQLFHPFFRLDDRGARLGPGLGLAITKGFLSLMNGEIWVEDTRGGGATLAFTLPADDGGEEQRAHPGR
jgi:two-component system sensor histidine kinase KdpD